MAYPSVDNCSNSASVSATSAARMFSSRWSTLDVPGIGSMTGERRSSQASASWAGVAPCAFGGGVEWPARAGQLAGGDGVPRDEGDVVGLAVLEHGLG